MAQLSKSPATSRFELASHSPVVAWAACEELFVPTPYSRALVHREAVGMEAWKYCLGLVQRKRIPAACEL